MHRRLILLRHAKSDWSDSSRRDFDRPLNKRGNRNAPAMGRLLRENQLVPQLVISSDANRAQTTARLVAAELGYDEQQIRLSNALYLAAPRTMLELLAEVDADTESVMMVAHNPGMTDLANRLSDARIDNLPTCGVFVVDFDTPDWTAVGDRPGTFVYFWCPRQHLA